MSCCAHLSSGHSSLSRCLSFTTPIISVVFLPGSAWIYTVLTWCMLWRSSSSSSLPSSSSSSSPQAPPHFPFPPSPSPGSSLVPSSLVPQNLEVLTRLRRNYLDAVVVVTRERIVRAVVSVLFHLPKKILSQTITPCSFLSSLSVNLCLLRLAAPC